VYLVDLALKLRNVERTTPEPSYVSLTAFADLVLDAA
jgi:hypothetical protein